MAALGVLFVAGLALAASRFAGATPSQPTTADPPPLRPLSPGRVDGPPSLRSLPDLDVDASELSPEMQRALELAEAAFAIAPPEPPHEATRQAFAAWASDAMSTFLRRKLEAILAARDALRPAGERDPRQQILASAVLGLLYEDIIRACLSPGIPSGPGVDPEGLDGYRRVLESQARPFVMFVRSAYESCVADAERSEGMRPFGPFCRERLDRLPVPPEPADEDATDSEDETDAEDENLEADDALQADDARK